MAQQQQGGAEQKRPSIWTSGAFCGLLADPFVEGNSQVPEGSLKSVCSWLEFVLSERPLLKKWKESPLMEHLATFRGLASVEVDKPEKLAEFVKAFTEKLKSLSSGELVFIPGGWVGSTTRASLVYIAENCGNGTYSLTICNAGAGLNYHPCRVTVENPEKLKYQTCLCLKNLTSERFLDPSFWTTLFVQWMKPSEFHRVEVLYDVLFPWICGNDTLANAVEESQALEEAEWRTPMRAGSSSAWRNLMEAVRYFLVRHYGCSRAEMKELTTLLKCELLAIALQDLEEDGRDPPTQDEMVLVRMGCKTAAHAVLKTGRVDTYPHVEQLVEKIEKKLVSLENQDQDTDSVYPEPFDASKLDQSDTLFPNIIISDKDTERYAGLAEEPRTALVCDILQVPTKQVSSIEDAVAALVRCEKVCNKLNERCRDGSSFSSRIALQLQVAELIRSVFTAVLPLPTKPGSSESSIWRGFPSKELELTCLRLIHRLAIVYGTAWQSFDAPTRAFDSERASVALCMLCIFDCVIRNDAFGLEVSRLLNDDGGYCLSTSLCIANLELLRVASTMEVHLPGVAIARSQCLEYFETLEKNCKYKDLFTFRMPTDKIEIKKYGTSVLFLRKLMEAYGYELVPRDNPMPPPEIESLMEWMTSPSSLLAREHPEYGMLRDMSCLFKFLCTMESRESELQRQRIAPSEYVSWGLSFEDTSMEAGTFHSRRSLLGNGLRWEVLNYRGLDLDTADVQVTCFGDRKLYFGEGLVVHSPADVNALLNYSGDQRPTEDDILHSDSLPTFGDTLSRQESEMLMSYLTVPYLRIPLTLAFFATGDRVTYLFSHELQALLRAVLFDASDWVPYGDGDKIDLVPVQSNQVDMTHLGGRPVTNNVVLGTSNGLLLNELIKSPEATMRPLMKMLKSINDLAEASVYSPDASLSLYLIDLAIDVQGFLLYSDQAPDRELEMEVYLASTCRGILKKWLKEAMDENDLETSCMIHAYLALIWCNLKPSNYDTENISELMGSLCFVRNWHGFGLGDPCSLLGYGSSTDSADPPEQRLLRFMQAHGVDTGRIAKGSLQKYLGQRRPLYLRIGAKTLRVPTLDNDTDTSKKKLLANVPEQKLFRMLQSQRHHIVEFLTGLQQTSETVLAKLFNRAVAIALDTTGTAQVEHPQGVTAAWTSEGRGVYLSPDKEMTFDVQCAQIMWRNDELKPLPDSMTHFNDFHAIFGKQQLHCGVVAYQQHRKWVHVVGTPYDLLLWDEPQDDDQGLEVPRELQVEEESSNMDVDESNFWNCQACTYRNRSSNQGSCEMCGTPKVGATPPRPPQQQQQGGEQEDKSPKAIEYNGVRYDRHLDPFSKESLESFPEEERWVLELLVPALRGHFKDQMPWKVLLTHDKTDATATKVIALAGARTEHEVEDDTPSRGTMRYMQQESTRKVIMTTWKEFVLYRERKVLHVFNFVSHGRKMYRQLVFSSDSKVGFHVLAPSKSMFGACGDLKSQFMLEQSLVITRNRNGIVETYIPSRLLFGVLPSVLLEAYQFWYGVEDDILRGEPLDAESTWFGSKEIEISKDGRKILQKPKSTIKPLSFQIGVGDEASLRRRLVVEGQSTASGPQPTMKEFDQTLVLDLCALGFSPAAARLALSKCNGNSAFAAEWLLHPDHEAQVANADDIVIENRKYKVVSHGTVRVRAAPTEAEDVGYVSNQVSTLSFGESVTVLERAGNWVRILDEQNPTKEAWVLSFHPEHGAVLEPEGEQVPSQGLETSGAVQKAVQKEKEEATKTMEIDYESESTDEIVAEPVCLVNLLDEPKKDSGVYNLLTTLTGIEDLSHILVWCNRETRKVELIELARLKLRMRPENGKLLLVDQAGWYVCNETKRTRALLDVHSLLLMNFQREIQYLVPNHDASRPTIKGRPFNTEIACERGSFAWLQTMDTRYFLYPIHTSGTYLVSQELSASIYLVHLLLIQRRYKETFHLAPTCTVDVPFAADEGFIWSQLERSMDDQHPDAHACRLKLALAIMYARHHIRTPWEVHVEYDRYLAKLPRVSAYCRLSREEELKITQLTTMGTPIIKNRLVTLQAKQRAPVELKAPAVRIGGSPWNKVHSQTLTYFQNHGTTLKRVQFKPQVGDASFDNYLTDILFSDHVVADEESGANRQLGFTFLFQLLTSPGTVPGSNFSPRRAGDILTRYLHLKLSRWGRESVSEGEVEASNSRHMAELAAVIAQPDRVWPKIPLDTQSVQYLRNGINLYTEQGRQSQVKLWLDLVDVEWQQAWPAIVDGNTSARRSLPAFVLKDFPNTCSFPISPALVVDTGCSARTVPNEEMKKVMMRPLGDLWSTYIETVPSSDRAPHDVLPFDLHSHATAQTTVAKEILLRLEEDVRGYAKAFKESTQPVLKNIHTTANLVKELESLQAKDAQFVKETIKSLVKRANKVSTPELVLKNRCNLRDEVDFSILTQALLSGTSCRDLQRINPTLTEQDVESMLSTVVEVLVFTNRISHANRAIVLGRSLADAKSDSFQAKQLARSLAECVATCRWYVEENCTFDPRFLVFEYVFDILLRERQVEIVRSFVEDVKHERSHVQQMIMGAGKTTVVAPLLTLLLANGETLVSQVMPTALLEQTRHIMRTRFSAIITKRVFTLEFDRSCDDSIDVAKDVFEKLDEARRSRSVICASPDAVKSLFLKFIEHMHSLESVDPEVISPSTSLRQNKEIVMLRDTMQKRSDMADCIIPIFQMWNDGVLIMDEVDVLLHPLRSELNFPIGLKDPIDMAGFRWDLPIHILSAFFSETKDESEGGAKQLLYEIDAIVENGYISHALQRNPHLVLLDEKFYREHLMRPVAHWCVMWIESNAHDLPAHDICVDYLVTEELDQLENFPKLVGDNMKLLNLGRDWIRVLLPHVLSKIDRVSFGVLSRLDLANIDQKRTPMSRKLMAVPFVGKDVPSRSSEFAHPDVVIGLSVLGYRYEGLRLSDVKTIVTQLKADFTRQIGPRDQRPASRIFRGWLEHAAKDDEVLPVLPLPLFQVNDRKQLERLFQILCKETQVIIYYLKQHVFPACMNFQSIKISACGHELGSSMLFKKRIGFSGTPSNLLPIDLGECLYEPGSDGRIMHVLSSTDVVSMERKHNWTAKSLLRDVACGSFNALIDTGALITGMDNEQVARYLLEHLPESTFEGVVYLDRADRKMFLQRSSGKSLHLSQCGVDPSRRFTFYDQVHTTGMDIKQSPSARAVVTIGKDMTFRDYAQGSFRMRGIGNGQTIHLFLIPEVEQLIKNELELAAPCRTLDVPAWLLINSMKMETIQYSMLSLQELYNCWRKEALHGLVEDCTKHSSLLPNTPEPKSRSERLRRFDGKQEMKKCINLFREPVGFNVPEEMPTPQPFHDKIHELIAEHEHFSKNMSLINSIAERTRYTKDLKSEELEAEIVNENEQEQQQQQEEEAEEEQEKVSRYTRDDEQANPWNISHLNKTPSCEVGDEPFYSMSSFTVRSSQPRLDFCGNLLVSDNWFRPRWIGLGDRRLKNVMVVLEWDASSFSLRLAKMIPLVHNYLVTEKGAEPNAAAFAAFTICTNPQTSEDMEVQKRFFTSTEGTDGAGAYYVAISLSEAETLRRVLHTNQSRSLSDFSLLSIEDGGRIDGSCGKSSPFLPLACLRFVNCDMYYTDEELVCLEKTFKNNSIGERIHFFEDCLRLRRREKHLWGDTPLARLFTEKGEWHLLEARAKLQQMSLALLRMLSSKKNSLDVVGLFSRADSDNDGALSYSEMQRMLEGLQLGFSPADVATIVRLTDKDGSKSISWKTFIDAFKLPEELLAQSMERNHLDLEAEKANSRWQCSNCTYINFASDVACDVCGYGWAGTLHVPSDKWMCDPAYGGCTFFNPEGHFYCEMCNKSKPSLQSV
eukprot:CAMPEP_0203758104 /NCGR_PEP_ID=MMETSP0098-20131031/10854_1 /ASSEMBLY_ACC=CAM_ASM_000208 /TAXON_ID=96639 /ORGANISM=" , Strain NY0313808BC1" /LENGTH=3866 /DNA_ID=CAMNT_0050650355 /DNA_START=244 /DNA_END=11840 /DNA_ORIENTATION=-